MDDPVVDGQAWAQRQEDAFGDWIVRYGGGDPAAWDYGLDSLDTLTYLLFHQFPTEEHLSDPRNEAFVDGAAWYLGEIVRRSEPKKRRWTRRTYEYSVGEYLVAHTAKTRSDEYVAPQSHLSTTVIEGNPHFLRGWYADYVAPLWDQPWPVWVQETGTGTWSWDADGVRWVSQRDRWRESIARLLDTLGEALPDIELDCSTASLGHVERFLLDDAASDPLFRSAVGAYLGECLLRAGGEKWTWDDRPDHITNGFPVVERSTFVTSPAHVVEYALAWRDGDTFARVHRGALACAASLRERGHVLRREPTPGLDDALPPSTGQVWADLAANHFGAWVSRYGPYHSWDFSPDSLDALAQVILAHCPVGVHLLDGGAGDDFYEGAVWYFGETLRRGKPSRWECRPFTNDDGTPMAGSNGSAIAGMGLWTRVTHDKDVGIRLVQQLSNVVWSWAYPTVTPPIHDPDGPRKDYARWVAGPVRWRTDESLKRRERVKARSWRTLDDEQFLARWLAEREAASDEWVRRHGIRTLDDLEAEVWRIGGPEPLLEGPANAEFLDGAIWYLGEELLRHAAGAAAWRYERSWGSDPYVRLRDGVYVEPVKRLARVFADVQRRGGTLRVDQVALRTPDVGNIVPATQRRM